MHLIPKTNKNSRERTDFLTNGLTSIHKLEISELKKPNIRNRYTKFFFFVATTKRDCASTTALGFTYSTQIFLS
jgi:hypothetical protein